MPKCPSHRISASSSRSFSIETRHISDVRSEVGMERAVDILAEEDSKAADIEVYRHGARGMAGGEKSFEGQVAYFDFSLLE